MFTFKNGKARSNASIIKEHLESLDKIANPTYSLCGVIKHIGSQNVINNNIYFDHINLKNTVPIGKDYKIYYSVLNALYYNIYNVKVLWRLYAK